MSSFNSFDIDGVIDMGPGQTGVWPGPNDIIITGRSFEEESETNAMLTSRGIENSVFYNPCAYQDKTREKSGLHKAKIIAKLKPAIHFEDDPIQVKIIAKHCPTVKIVMLEHNLTEKENCRHLWNE